MDCIFCKIAQKKLPARVVYEDDLALAFSLGELLARVRAVLRRSTPETTTRLEAGDLALGQLGRDAVDPGGQRRLPGPGRRGQVGALGASPRGGDRHCGQKANNPAAESARPGRSGHSRRPIA